MAKEVFVKMSHIVNIMMPFWCLNTIYCWYALGYDNGHAESFLSSQEKCIFVW